MHFLMPATSEPVTKHISSSPHPDVNISRLLLIEKDNIALIS
jgi:hypothetical protein